MKRIVADASVALKWFFRERRDEPDVEQALQLLTAAASGQLMLVQPPHFVAEVAAVLARDNPLAAHRDLQRLLALDMKIVGEPDHYALAMTLADRHKQHLFDTLYHALALRIEGAVLVTADERYERKAHREGRMVLLRKLRLDS